MKRRNAKAPGFPIVRASLIAASFASACVGVAGWLLPEAANLLTLAAAPAWIWAIFAALSAIVVPASLEMLGRSWASLLMLFPAAVFGAVNAYSFHHAYEALIEEPARSAYEAAEIAPKQAIYEAAQLAVIGHTLPTYPAEMNVFRIRENNLTWDKAHAALIEAEAKAKAAFDVVPAYAPAIPSLLVWIISGLIDLCLAVGLASVALTRCRIEAKQKAERLAARAAAKKTAAKALAKPRKPVSLLSPSEQAALIRERGAPLTVVR